MISDNKPCSFPGAAPNDCCPGSEPSSSLGFKSLANPAAVGRSVGDGQAVETGRHLDVGVGISLGQQVPLYIPLGLPCVIEPPGQGENILGSPLEEK